jgi:hypothetical protein
MEIVVLGIDHKYHACDPGLKAANAEQTSSSRAIRFTIPPSEDSYQHNTLTTQSLDFVLGLPLRNRLPMHVRRRVRSAELQRANMVNNVTGASPSRPASGRARMLPLEGVLGGG